MAIARRLLITAATVTTAVGACSTSTQSRHGKTASKPPATPRAAPVEPPKTLGEPPAVVKVDAPSILDTVPCGGRNFPTLEEFPLVVPPPPEPELRMCPGAGSETEPPPGWRNCIVTRRTVHTQFDAPYDSRSRKVLDGGGRVVREDVNLNGERMLNIFHFSGNAENADAIAAYRDKNRDGEVDHAELRHFTPDNRVCFVLKDTNLDGTPDSTSFFEYQERTKQLVRLEADDDGDGELDRIVVTHRDADGNVLEEVVTERKDGSMVTRRYDAQRNPLP